MPTLTEAAPPVIARQPLPSMYDLPSEEIGDAGMPDEYHVHQATLLAETFRPPAFRPDEYFSAVDMNLYYDPRHPTWYKRPDWFAALGVSRLYEGRDSRLSYVTWYEGIAPFVVVELLSPGTEKEDLGETTRRSADEPPPKWEVYERILRVPYYVVFSREADEMRVFKLNGGGYSEVSGHGGKFWMPQAELGLGLWHGSYKGIERLWLRWYDAEGNWIQTDAERAEQERQRAEEARQQAEEARQHAEEARQEKEDALQQAERERQRAERLAEMLRQLGHDPNQI
jgi:Uma2 family endonuclease